MSVKRKMRYLTDALMFMGLGWITSMSYFWYMSNCLGTACILMYSTPIAKFW